jgi:hypothetical protein
MTHPMNRIFYDIKYISATCNLLKSGYFLKFEVFTSNMEKWPIRPLPHNLLFHLFSILQFYRNSEISETDYFQSVTYCIPIKEEQISPSKRFGY